MGIQEINDRLNAGIQFVVGRLSNFTTITLGEQISYSAIAVGIILMITGAVLILI